jgi:hypothetical protein
VHSCANRTELNILQTLHTAIFCGDGLSLAATSQLVSHGVGTSSSISLMNVRIDNLATVALLSPAI